MDSSNNNEKLEIKEIKAETVPPAKDGVKKAGSKKEKEKKPVVQEIFEWVEIIALSLSFVLLMEAPCARRSTTARR